MNRKYSGFTLVEMLIVMGIIIILMAVGIAAGRFAINRANDVAHQNAADQLFIAAQSYLTDNREYPLLGTTGWTGALATEGAVNEYLTTGEFKGGTDTTFLYWTNGSRDAALVCVSLGGVGDEDERGHYCTGNGFSSETSGPGAIALKENDPEDAFPTTGWCAVSTWNNEDGEFSTESSEAETITTDCGQTYTCTSCGGTVVTP